MHGTSCLPDHRIGDSKRTFSNQRVRTHPALWFERGGLYGTAGLGKSPDSQVGCLTGSRSHDELLLLAAMACQAHALQFEYVADFASHLRADRYTRLNEVARCQLRA